MSRLLVPRVGTDWVRVCSVPDLGELANADPSRHRINDHGFIRDRHGNWQLWAAVQGTKAGQLFYGWEGKSLRSGGWEPRGIKLRAEARYAERIDPENKEAPELLQAPYFLREGDRFYCFYDSMGARLLTSDDGVNYSRALDAGGNNMLYRKSGRDLMIRRENGLYFVYSTVSVTIGDWGSGYIIVRTSPDLRRWSDFTIVSQGGRGGGSQISAESPFVLKLEGYYYLFRSSSSTRSTWVYRSTDPYDFGVNTDAKLIAELPVFAGEVIEDGGRMFISDVHDFKGIRVTTLDWEPAPAAQATSR